MFMLLRLYWAPRIFRTRRPNGGGPEASLKKF